MNFIVFFSNKNGFFALFICSKKAFRLDIKSSFVDFWLLKCVFSKKPINSPAFSIKIDHRKSIKKMVCGKRCREKKTRLFKDSRSLAIWKLRIGKMSAVKYFQTLQTTIITPYFGKRELKKFALSASCTCYGDFRRSGELKRGYL